MIKRNGPGRPRRAFWQCWNDEREWLRSVKISYQTVANETGIIQNRVRTILDNHLSAKPDEEQALIKFFQQRRGYAPIN